MNTTPDIPVRERWARLRFAIIGPLLAAPPPRGELQTALKELALKTWRHPVTGAPKRFDVSTIERWYYKALKAPDPVMALGRRRRKDAGRQRSLSEALRQTLWSQYRMHPGWTIRLHTDNLAVLVAEEERLGPMPSYPSVRRFMQANGLIKRRRQTRQTPGAQQAEHRLETREVRSYEVEHTNALWHLDYHHGSRKVLTRDGAWVTPQLLGVLDDHSRLACHLQWYLDETSGSLVHGLSQAFQKRKLPRVLMTDNGAAMVAAETRQGLHDLSIVHETILPYSPYQNAKQEVFWALVEGRLMAMLEGCPELTLELLNEATCAWVELEYNRTRHSEIGTTPLARFLQSRDVGRESPGSDDLRRAFRVEVTRTQRRSDGTLSLEGRRFEVPSRYRHLQRLHVRYARWDLSHIDLVDEHTGTILSPLYPLDKSANANGQRRYLDPLAGAPTVRTPSSTQTSEVAPLLRHLMGQYAATGLPPAYLPKASTENNQEETNP